MKAALTAAQGALHTFSTELENAGLPSPLAAGRGPAPRQQVWTKGKAGEAVLRQPRPRLSDDRAPASAAWAGHMARHRHLLGSSTPVVRTAPALHVCAEG